MISSLQLNPNKTIESRICPAILWKVEFKGVQQFERLAPLDNMAGPLEPLKFKAFLNRGANMMRDASLSDDQ